MESPCKREKKEKRRSLSELHSLGGKSLRSAGGQEREQKRRGK